MSYTEGTDRTRNQTSYLNDPLYDRSGEPGVEVEPLPGIPPLDSRIGFLLHDPNYGQNWGVEFTMRAVGRQNRVATTLDEIVTPGFVTLNTRAYKRIRDSWLMTAGVENMTDRFYREHLDYRSGLGVYRPGVGFYTGIEWQY